MKGSVIISQTSGVFMAIIKINQPAKEAVNYETNGLLSMYIYL